MKYIRFLCVAFCTVVIFGVQGVLAADKSDLKILYVGDNPDKASLDYDEQSRPNAEEILNRKKMRPKMFSDFLKKHFEKVDVIVGEDYKESLSNNYDVTIFDARPKVLEEAVMRENYYAPAKYLSEEFDNAAILISEVSAEIGQGINSKIDWLCLCLDANAHDVDASHPIFNTPLKVNLTFEDVPTPETYTHYYNGRNLGKFMPMWRVQKEGYLDGNGYPIGLVATAEGFVDATDSEIISAGVSSKSKNTVALGRHANLFHWGFSAAPDDMTQEAQEVFLNVIHYIEKFNGQKPYSHRKYRKASREFSIELAFMAKEADYEGYKDTVQAGFDYMKNVLKQKEANGEELSFAEKRQLNAESPDFPDRETWIKTTILGMLPKSVTAKFGTDLDSYLPYYKENIEYLIPAAGPFQFVVDQDVKSLGLSNRQVSTLDKLITMLERSDNTELAKRILERYTYEKFDSVTQWRAWFEAYKNRLFFSDVNNYKFDVAPYEVNNSQ